jgi:hypothetical protein
MDLRETFEYVRDAVKSAEPGPGRSGPRMWSTALRFVVAQLAGLLTNGFVLTGLALAAVAAFVLLTIIDIPTDVAPTQRVACAKPALCIVGTGASRGSAGSVTVVSDPSGQYRVVRDGLTVAGLSAHLAVGSAIVIDARARIDFGFLTGVLVSDGNDDCAWELPGMVGVTVPQGQQIPIRMPLDASGALTFAIRTGVPARCRITDIGLQPRISDGTRTRSRRSPAEPVHAEPTQSRSGRPTGAQAVTAPPGATCAMLDTPLFGLGVCVGPV